LSSPTGDFLEGLALLRRYWFDTALSSTPSALPSLAFADHNRITFGSDWPYVPDLAVTGMTAMYETYELDVTIRNNIDNGNAARMVPRLARR
jgi:hypothetical protein